VVVPTVIVLGPFAVLYQASGVVSESANLTFDGTNLTLANGNLGLGVSPGTWGANQKAVQVATFGAFWDDEYAATVNMGNNVIQNGDTTYKYLYTGSTALLYLQGGGAHIWSNALSGTAGNSITFTTRMTLDANGKLIVPAVYSNAVGATNKAAYVDSTGLLGYLSSIRAAKMNIAEINNVAWVFNLSPVTFNYRQKDENGNYLDFADGKLQYGLIAEDVAQQNADFCYYDGDGNLEGVAYDKLTVPLLKAIQTIKADLDVAKARIATLEGAAQTGATGPTGP